MNEIFISDFSCVEPAEAWTDADANVFKPIAQVSDKTWRLIDYKTAGFSGKMLQTSNPDAPVLSLPLNGKGWHAISIGMSDRTHAASGIEVRLSGSKRWQALFACNGPLHEEPWLFADITGQQLEIRYPQHLEELPVAVGPCSNFAARIFSVRCTPMREEHVEELLAENQRCPLLCTNDGFGIFFTATRPGKHIVADRINQFKDSDFNIYCFSPGGPGALNYRSRYGNLCGENGWDFPRSGDRNMKEMLHQTLAMGIDPLRQAIEQTHANNQESWIYLRPQLWSSDPVHDHMFRSDFFQQHPEYRCVEADGTAFSKLSIAFPAVREQLNGLIGEALERGADGICLALVRGYPLVRYEQPVRDRCRELYGIDAIKLPETDPRLRLVWAEFVTDWLREVRNLVDQAGRSERCERRKLSVIVGSGTEWNAGFGFDVADWAQAGLIDAVMPYWKGNEDRPGHLNVAEFADLLEGTDTLLLPMLGSCFDHRMTLADIRRRAYDWYQSGADGLSRWDAKAYLGSLNLNSPVQQRLWCEHYLAEQQIELREIAGISLLYFGPGLAT